MYAAGFLCLQYALGPTTGVEISRAEGFPTARRLYRRTGSRFTPGHVNSTRLDIQALQTNIADVYRAV